MSTIVQSLRELCDDHIEIVLKIERFRKAILEDVEHYLLPGHMDPIYRSAFLAPNNLSHSFGNKNQMHSMANLSPLANGNGFYNAPPHSYFPNMGNNIRQSNMTRGGGNVGGRRINNVNAPQLLPRQPNSRQSDYQLKVGGVVVGSWAGGVPNKPIGGGYLRYPRTGIINNKRRGSQHLNIRNSRVGMANNSIGTRAISRNAYAGKVHKNRKQRRTKDKKLSLGNASDGNVNSEEVTEGEKTNEDAAEAEDTSTKECVTEELTNGITILAAEQNDDKTKDTYTIPSTVQKSVGNNDDIKSTVDITTEVSETSAIVNNNNESITTNAKECKTTRTTNGNVVNVAGKNKKKNKKGKIGANNENGINKDEIEECEGQGDTAVQV